MTVHSYHDPAALLRALTLAQKLWSAATAIDGAESGRNEAETRAQKDWLGPHADSFVDMYGHERELSTTTRGQLEAEAQAWAQFWLDCTNARTERLHRERMDNYERSYLEADGSWAEDRPNPPQRGTIFSTPPQPPAFAPLGVGFY